MIYPVITLHQPSASWIIRGWKTIETRTHDRFKSLEGKTILIHAGMKTDANAVNNPYLIKEQILHEPDKIINGYILGEAYLEKMSALHGAHSTAALINCSKTRRYGLFLTGIKEFKEPIPCKGSQGIWYYDITNKQKVKK